MVVIEEAAHWVECFLGRVVGEVLGVFQVVEGASVRSVKLVGVSKGDEA